MNNSLPEIWNCPEAFEFVCTQKWDSLASTDLDNVRHCNVCNERVYWSANPEEFVTNSKQGRCVAVPRTAMPLDGELAGRVSPEYYRDRANHKAEYQLWRSGWNLILDRDPFFILCLIRKGYPDALELYIELATKLPAERELTRRAHILLARSDDRQPFVQYLLNIGCIDEAIAITRSTQNRSIGNSTIRTLLRMNLVTEARQLLPVLDRHDYCRCICAIADKMSELGQHTAAIELYENYLADITNNFTDLEMQISNRLLDVRLLELFSNLVVDFPAEADFVKNTCEVLADKPRRKKFVIYLLDSKHIDLAVAIAKTLDCDSHLLMYLVARFSEINEVEAAQKIVSFQAFGQAQFDGLNWIISRLRSSHQISRAIEVCQWYLANMQNIPTDLEAEVVQQISSLRLQLDRS
ncbi:hypothetical protein [Chamaesiphon minutus]|uniref:Uncharacterized protein n=1 Tax=Chamaesiphon minutus (strain ATCC 27169 / PCC 6605) TaxID=1173020 RepID=K9UGK9_CHAP6|nr:hypothetical protein [Chamaesiphon minutus]AFY93960.1 hypothetical protein Cha6605_2928 [Chamaesiphon minutus PCC 6605]